MAGAEDDELDTLIAALERGLTSITPDTGVGLLDQWRERLSHESDPHLREIAEDLDTLRRTLDAQQPDPVVIGGILQGLGEKTKRVAAGAGDAGERLRTLGDALEDQGRAVSGHG